jgi:hypothetical protein
MRKLAFLAFLSILPASARVLPRPIVIHGMRPTTAWLRQEFLSEPVQYHLHKQEFNHNLERLRFPTAYDRMTRLTTYYDNHLLDQLNRVDNAYGHNRPGIGIHF